MDSKKMVVMFIAIIMLVSAVYVGYSLMHFSKVDSANKNTVNNIAPENKTKK